MTYIQQHIQENSIGPQPSLLRLHQTSNIVLPRFARQALAVNTVLDSGQHSIHFLDAKVCVQHIQGAAAAKCTVRVFKPPRGIFLGFENLCGMSVNASETEDSVRFVWG